MKGPTYLHHGRVRVYLVGECPHDQFHLGIRHLLCVTQPSYLMMHIKAAERIGRKCFIEVLSLNGEVLTECTTDLNNRDVPPDSTHTPWFSGRLQFCWRLRGALSGW